MVANLSNLSIPFVAVHGAHYVNTTVMVNGTRVMSNGTKVTVGTTIKEACEECHKAACPTPTAADVG